MSLGERIVQYRREKRMSQGDLAQALDVSRQSVSKWENDASVPELDKLVKMSRLFGITLDELVSGEAPASPMPPQEPSVQPQSRFSRRKVFGIAFWCFYALIVLALALGGEGLSGMLLGLPFLICGTMCYGSRLKHLVLWCIWVFALPLIFVPFYEFIRIHEAVLITAVLWGGMLVLTVWCLRKDPVVPNRRRMNLLLLGHGLCFGYLLIRILEILNLWNLVLISDKTMRYWGDALAYLLFTTLLSVSTRILKQHKVT